ncbi:Origin recognition complex subunit 5 [Podochytrium sp. JEL0797]|nr:Origin recognition complex subunit 5 [Podochytrium sp. JEL0797]
MARKTPLPGRETQVAQLQRIADSGYSGCVYLYGLPATGKSAALRCVFGAAKVVDAVRCFTPALLAGAAAAALGVPPGSAPSLGALAVALGASSDASRDVSGEASSRPGHAPSHTFSPRALVIDNAHELRSHKPSPLAALLRLAAQTNTTIILASPLPWLKFKDTTEANDPLLLYFPAYTFHETRAILRLDCPPGEDEDLFMQFVDVTQSVMHRPCRDLNELRHVVALLYPKYKEPVESGKIPKTEGARLYNAIMLYFKEVIDKLYIRKVSSSEWTQASEGTNAITGAKALHALDTFDMDLPYNTTYLLLASFIASYNPKGLDVRFFARASEKRIKKPSLKKKDKSAKLRQQLLGPKPFPIERMLAIFYRIKEDTHAEDQVESLVDIQMQITSLVSKGLLLRMGGGPGGFRIDEVKCKVNIGLETAYALAGRVRFDLGKYLHDFKA